MTAYAENDRRTTTAGWPMFAALGAGTAVVLSAVGTFWDVTGSRDTNNQGLRELLVVAGIILVATALVYGFVVRGAGQGNAGTRAVILAVLGFLSLVAFWSGLPPVLAVAAIACAVIAREKQGAFRMPSLIAVGIAVLTLGLAVVAALVG